MRGWFLIVVQALLPVLHARNASVMAQARVPVPPASIGAGAPIHRGDPEGTFAFGLTPWKVSPITATSHKYLSSGAAAFKLSCTGWPRSLHLCVGTRFGRQEQIRVIRPKYRLGMRVCGMVATKERISSTRAASMATPLPMPGTGGGKGKENFTEGREPFSGRWRAGRVWRQASCRDSLSVGSWAEWRGCRRQSNSDA